MNILNDPKYRRYRSIRLARIEPTICDYCLNEDNGIQCTSCICDITTGEFYDPAIVEGLEIHHQTSMNFKERNGNVDFNFLGRFKRSHFSLFGLSDFMREDLDTLRNNFVAPDYLTNSWTKLFEILSKIDALKTREPKVTALFLGELPGSSVSALYHYCRTRIQKKLIWRAQSLNPFNEFNDPRLMWFEDEFYYHYPENWFLNCFDGTGDIRNIGNAEFIAEECRKLSKSQGVDIVIGDVTVDYPSKEARKNLTPDLHLSETIVALQCLAKGGTFILTVFNLFDTCSLNVLFLLGCHFEEVEIVKPQSSRPGNLELFVVAKGFRGLTSETLVHLNSYLTQPMTSFKGCTFSNSDVEIFAPNFLSSYQEAVAQFYIEYMDYMKAILLEYAHTEEGHRESWKRNFQRNRIFFIKWIAENKFIGILRQYRLVEEPLFCKPYKKRILSDELYNNGRNDLQTDWASDILDLVAEKRKKFGRWLFPVPEPCQDFTVPPELDVIEDDNPSLKTIEGISLTCGYDLFESDPYYIPIESLSTAKAKEIIAPLISKKIDGADCKNPFGFCYWRLTELVATRFDIYENCKKFEASTFADKVFPFKNRRVSLDLFYILRKYPIREGRLVDFTQFDRFTNFEGHFTGYKGTIFCDCIVRGETLKVDPLLMEFSKSYKRNFLISLIVILLVFEGTDQTNNFEAILRLSTTMSRFSAGCIFLLSTLFEVRFVRPHSCPPWTEERYLVCTWLPRSPRDISILIPALMENLELALKKINEAAEGYCLLEIVSPVTIVPTDYFYKWLRDSNTIFEKRSLKDLEAKTSYRLRRFPYRLRRFPEEKPPEVVNKWSEGNFKSSAFQANVL